MPESRVLLGIVLGAHGIKGEVKVRTFTTGPDALNAYGPVATEDGRVFTIASLRTAKGNEVIVTFADIGDRSAAEGLKGQRLFVPRAALPQPAEGEFYHADLVGLAAEDETGAALGQVKAVHNFGAGDVIEIEDASGEARFVPFTMDTVPIVDLANKRIVVRSQRDADE